jgi:hypothetical protein
MFENLKFKGAIAAAALSIGVSAAPAVDAATLNGTFTIDIYHRLNATAAESAASVGNLDAGEKVDTITYTGDLSFATSVGSSTTIGSWLATGLGTVTGLDLVTAGLQLSKANIDDGSATTTFFDIVGVFASGFNSIVRHDDGITAFDDGAQLATSAEPTTVINTAVNGFDGGVWRLIYAATNSDPSILQVTGDNLPSTVPVPAAGFLLFGALGGLAALRRRKSLAA